MTWNDIVVQVVQYLIPVIGALLVALLGYLVTYISKQQEKIKNDILRESIGAALAEAHVVGRDAIVATQQVLIDDFKEASHDGKLTREEAAQGMEAAKQYFISHISTNSVNILREAIGPIKDWLDTFLEAKLGEYKGEVQANPSSPGLAS